MNTKNTASQPKVASIADDAQFMTLLYKANYTASDASACGNDFGTGDRAQTAEDALIAYLDSKLRAPADQAASVGRTEHPNHHVPLDTACSEKLDDLGDDRGQGLDPYWKFGFRTGWHYAKASVAAAEGQVSAAAPAPAACPKIYTWGGNECPLRFLLDSLDSYSKIMPIAGRAQWAMAAAAKYIRASGGQAQTSAAVDEFAQGVIAALGVMTAHGYPHGSTFHDEIVHSVGEASIYAAAKDEDYEWAGLDPSKKPVVAQPAEGSAPERAAAGLNGGMHASIFAKVWGEAGGGDAGRIALANYAYDLGTKAPIQMILFCPKCGKQHIDAPDKRTADWDNPPHRSHLCHECGNIWRPADVSTEGVAAIKTVGSNDSAGASGGQAQTSAAQASDEPMRAAFEAWVISEAQRQHPMEPLTEKEKAFVLRRNVWDKDSYEAHDGAWQAWKAAHAARDSGRGAGRGTAGCVVHRCH